MKGRMRMPSKKQYNLVTNDDFDSRIPLHPEEAFQHGIRFTAKYIGTLDVPRPTSRVEIVAAMRRIRYEFKAKGIKKKKVNFEVSVDGVKVSLRKKKKQSASDDARLLIMQHPIYRIFYVSHDSQDLKIFSYIARDAASNVFKCNVFKANKKNQAMRIVRTVGQAFEVCHKFSVKDTPPSPEPPEDEGSDKVSQASLEKPKKELIDADSIQDDLVTLTPSDTINEDAASNPHLHRPTKLEPLAPPQGSDILGTQLSEGAGETYTSPLSEPLQAGDSLPQPGTPLSIHHELQLMREQLKQQQQQTQAAVSQVHLLRDQLAAETAARLEAQARSHQLLVHKQELLERYQAVVLHVRDLELKLQAAGIISSSSPNATSLLPSSHELKTQLSVPISNPHPSPGGLSPCQSAVALDSEDAAPTALHTIDPPPTPSPGLATRTFHFPVPTQSPYASSTCLMAAGPQYLHVGATDSHFAPPPTSREPSPMAGPLIQPLPLSSGGGGPVSDVGEITLAVPQQDNNHLYGVPRLNPPPQRRVTRCEDGSTPSVSSEGDTKRDSGQSSGESVTHAIAQLYNLDNSSGRWLTQVPEDAVSMGPYGPTPLGASRLMNGPITRTASERVSRQETLAQLQRMAWARHTTK